MALGKLSEAIGRPTQKAVDDAKALFPFVALAASMENEPADDEESLPAPEGRPSRSADRHPAGR
ncbi:hypothetical protein [Streptomyces sp. NPDC058045]|uniref:hypothetical protein n=1 Tax=Streptomyces sp. NPDC058045 TaxID=3346311 RepID=UPI0036E60066